MSGILLPGQEKRPGSEPSSEPAEGPRDAEAPGSGLVLPGSAHRRAKGGRAADAPAGPPGGAGTEQRHEAQGAGQPAPGAEARGARPAVQGRRIMLDDLAFPPANVEVQCPSCGTPFTMPLFSIIDLGEDPGLKEPLMSGQINMARCPRCGTGGIVPAPLMVHVPAESWLGVVIPAEARMKEAQRQKMIGELTQALLRKLPQEKRKGYLLQARQYSDLETFFAKLWEFEGVTREELQRQQAQIDLLRSLISLANDPVALEMAIKRGAGIVDRYFFAQLDRMSISLMQNAAPEAQATLVSLRAIRDALLEGTEAGKKRAELDKRTERLRAELDKTVSRAEIIDILLPIMKEPDSGDVIGSLLFSLAPRLDYDFLMAVSARAEESVDELERTHLEKLRSLVLALIEGMQHSEQALRDEATQLLQELLQAEDLEEAVRNNLGLIDDTFLSVLVQTIEKTEQKGSKGAARRLSQVEETVVKVMQEQMPDDVRLLNELLLASRDRAALRQVLKENHDKLTPEFMAGLDSLEESMRKAGNTEMADGLKAVRAQARLMG